MGERAFEAAIADLCCAGYCPGETYATGSLGQAHAFTWSRVVDNYSGVIEGPWASRSYLTEVHPAAQLGSTVRHFVQTMLVQNEPHHAA
jgi:hypothetical protein